MIDASQFGATKKGKRLKTCNTCSAHAAQYYSDKKRITREIDWDTLPVRRHPLYANYGATEQGYVINLKTRKIIGKIVRDGYIQVGLLVPQLLLMYAHRFVYECFNGVIADQTMVVMHGDNDKMNNAPANLTLGTRSQNNADAYRDGLHPRTHIGKRARSLQEIWQPAKNSDSLRCQAQDVR